MPNPCSMIDASFWSRVFATLIGTLAGFIFSICLFYLTEQLKRSHERKNTVAHLKREASFNINLCESWLNSFNNIRTKMGADDRALYEFIDYTHIGSVIVNESHRTGMLYDILAADEIVAIDKAIRFCQPPPTSQAINTMIEQWKAGTIQNEKLSEIINLHEFVIKEIRRAFETLLNRVKEYKGDSVSRRKHKDR